jgi:hypothetical protein
MGVVLDAQRDHAFGAMMLLLAPWWIKVAPLQVRITASIYWTTESDFLAQPAPDFEGGVRFMVLFLT